MFRKSMLWFALSFLTTALVGLASVDGGGQQPASVVADMVLLNGKIVTVEDSQPQVEAIAIGGARIAALGTSAEIKRFIGPKTQVIDLKGQLVVPGFVEGHAHFNGVGLAQLNLNLMKAKTWDEIVRQVEGAAKKRAARAVDLRPRLAPGEMGRQAVAERRRFPDARVPEQGVPQQPRAAHARERARDVRERQGHGGLADVTPGTPNPPGGDFLKDANGNPTALFRETARGSSGPVRASRHAHPKQDSGTRAASPGARLAGGALEGRDLLSGRRFRLRRRSI